MKKQKLTWTNLKKDKMFHIEVGIVVLVFVAYWLFL